MFEIGKLTEIVGSSNISRVQEALDDFSKDMSFVHTIKPDCVVRPRNADDVQVKPVHTQIWRIKTKKGGKQWQMTI